MRPLVRFLTLTAALATAACSPVADDLLPVDPSAFSGSGALRTHETGSWVIDVPPSEVYVPTNLPAAFRHEGLRVRFTAIPAPGPEHRAYIGLAVELKHIERE